MNNWSVYLLRCSDGSLYCGVTTDMARRLRQHNAGSASKYTRSRLPVAFRAGVGGMTRSAALKFEYAVKQTPSSRKTTAFLEEGGWNQI